MEDDEDLRFPLERLRFSPATSPFDYIEVWHFKDQRKPVVETGIVFEADIVRWLEKDPKIPQGECSGGFRLLIHPASKILARASISVCFKEEIYHQIVNAFDLPMATSEAVSNEAGLHASVQQKGKSTGYVLKPFPGVVDFMVGLYTHNPITRFTCGLLRCNIERTAPEIFHRIRASAPLSNHPLFLSTICGEAQIQTMWKTSFTTGHGLLKIENRTGHIVIRGTRDQEATPPDYRDITMQLSKISYQIAFAEHFMGSISELCTFALNQLATGAADEETPLRREDTRILKERLECVASGARHAHLRFQMYAKRSQFQLSTVYNLIAQQDSILNIEIAKDSKSIALATQKDSAAMKTIAVITTLFLPATWAAAFFSIPLFDWKAETGAVMNGRLWIYWACTVPLTGVVMILWWVWMMWRRRREEVEDRRARESSVVNGIGGGIGVGGRKGVVSPVPYARRGGY